MQNQSFNLLKKIEEQETTARQFGFYWERLDQLIEQIKSECDEVEKAAQINDYAHLKEEIGDLLHAVVCLSIFCNVDAQDALSESSNKFQNRYDEVVKLTKMDGLNNLHNQPSEILMAYWNKAKLKLEKIGNSQ